MRWPGSKLKRCVDYWRVMVHDALGLPVVSTSQKTVREVSGEPLKAHTACDTNTCEYLPQACLHHEYFMFSGTR